MALNSAPDKWNCCSNFGTKYLSTLFGIVFLCHQFGAFAGAFPVVIF